MEIEEVSKEEYNKIVTDPFSGFDKVDFVELNKYKVDDNVKYFIFKDSRKRFGLVAGIRDNVLECPFSATFACFSEITYRNKILYYNESIKALVNWSIKNKINKIIFCTPALFYDETHITKLQNSLICNGFKILDYDVNYQFDLRDRPTYDSIINTDIRRNLKIAEKNNLVFTKTDDIPTVYKIIKKNREEKNYPLYMSEKNVADTTHVIKSDFFLVYYGDIPVASAYVQHIKKDIVNVVYWGCSTIHNKLCCMNFLAKNVYEYYFKQKNIKYINIGIATLDSVPNYGLCDFKEEIGCELTPKINFILNLEE